MDGSRESTAATRDYGVRNCGAPHVNKNDNRVARIRIGEDDNLVLFFLAKMPDGLVHNSIQVVRLLAHVRYGEPVSRAAVGGVEVSRRHNAPFVQALKDFITADSLCALRCWESDSAKHTKCLHVVPTKIDWQEILECEVLEAMETLTLLYKSVFEQRPLINATKVERETRSSRPGVWDWEVLLQKIYENLDDQDLRSLGDYVVELTTGCNEGGKAALSPERRRRGMAR